ncbi:TetR/AcrR family transcriptional regulator [[Mycobacterium] nativiensis]|uniref:TetR family transcriptional regulator n=1 Tax=[Mycobacterium] nativiensis TaxID=2855503 RepID=A0ABU5XWM5_9MYCO|nr:TetR family transcriptional regulator [Mycolicibacter sp. MYC340]MEB3032394.1 TetR family transcriptional regulator [Mycolicibacter sp. MYC340]
MKNATRAEQRAATRQALVGAAVEQLRTEGVAAVTTRRVAGAAEVSQSTVMYHFPTRDDLVNAAVAQLAFELADQARVHFEETTAAAALDLSGFLDLLWREFTTPQALSVAHLWAACWTDPQVAETVKSLEQHIFGLAVAAAEALPAPAPSFDPAAYMDTVVVLIRGLVISIPVWGLEFISAHWEVSKANLLKAAGVSVAG